MSVAAPPGGRFGAFGGTYVPESLVPACREVAEAFADAWGDPGFRTRYAALLAQRMDKRRLIAETGAGQHGVATATAAAMLGLGCTVYMGEVDIARQELNVFRMRLLGAEVVPVTTGS